MEKDPIQAAKYCQAKGNHEKATLPKLLKVSLPKVYQRVKLLKFLLQWLQLQEMPITLMKVYEGFYFHASCFVKLYLMSFKVKVA